MSPDLKSYLGSEYPAAVISGEVRMPLVAERRWVRVYATTDRQRWHEVSRFMDGSATITCPELTSEWKGWSVSERRDFYTACSWLREQADFADMLRYIMQHGGADDWSGIAGLIGVCLPQDEAFEILCRALEATSLETSCNIAQGISVTGHPGAEAVLRRHLAALCAHPGIRDDADFLNWIAFGAAHCIEYLIKTGAPVQDFLEEVSMLSAHACARNRALYRGLLAQHYPWLKEE